MPPRRPGVRLIGSPEHAARSLFAAGDFVMLDGGEEAAITVGDRYAARRIVSPVDGPAVGGTAVLFVYTSGWLRVTDVTANQAMAVVEETCSGSLSGDYLEPFTLPVVPRLQPGTGQLDFDSAGTVLFGLDARRTAATNDLVVVDRGSDHGIEPGQRFVIYRHPNGPRVRIGDAVALEVQPDSSMLRILMADDAVYSGDRVAPLRGR